MVEDLRKNWSQMMQRVGGPFYYYICLVVELRIDLVTTIQ